MQDRQKLLIGQQLAALYSF